VIIHFAIDAFENSRASRESGHITYVWGFSRLGASAAFSAAPLPNKIGQLAVLKPAGSINLGEFHFSAAELGRYMKKSNRLDREMARSLISF